jgi:NitT/TauT family transport system substrate-binding protein
MSRRTFLRQSSALSAATLVGLPSVSHAELPPETSTIRIALGPWICYAPQVLAVEQFRLEGFTDVQFVKAEYGLIKDLVAGRTDMAVFGAPSVCWALDRGLPIVSLAGMHVGCWELFADDSVRRFTDLRGKRLAMQGEWSVDHLWVGSLLGYLGMDPYRDVQWVPCAKMSETMARFVAGDVDAFLAFPPQPQEMRLRGSRGHVLLNTTFDRPWSQYFCCMLNTSRDFAQRNPVATKRAIRALLKAADICANEPEKAARALVEKNYEPRYEVGLEVLKSLPYGRWRTDNPADSLRFHALRLRDAGMIKATPQQILEGGTDFHFVEELKKELKA